MRSCRRTRRWRHQGPRSKRTCGQTRGHSKWGLVGRVTRCPERAHDSTGVTYVRLRHMDAPSQRAPVVVCPAFPSGRPLKGLAKNETQGKRISRKSKDFEKCTVYVAVHFSRSLLFPMPDEYVFIDPTAFCFPPLFRVVQRSGHSAVR